MPPHRVWPCSLIVIVFACPGSRAEVPSLRPDELKGEATHIVVGDLRKLYRSVEPGGDFELTRGIAEILVEEFEKGEGPKAGEVVFVRFWNQRWVGKGAPPPHASGHDVPAKGAVARVHAKRGPDGSYEALLPNGLTIVAEPAKRPR
jgi:hypothetical protein